MAASHAEVEQSADSIVLDMSQSMQTFAACGDWERVEEIAAGLRHAILQVPERRRRELLMSAQKSIEAVRTLANHARGEVTGQLSALRRGEDVRKAYGATD